MKEDKKTLVGAKIRLVGKECPHCGCRDLDTKEREEAFCAISAKTKAQKITKVRVSVKASNYDGE